MHAALSEDQVLLAAIAGRLADELACPPPNALPPVEDDIAGWRSLVDTGFSCMHVPETFGGGGAHSADAALVVEQFGRTLSAVPLLGQGVLAPELASRAGATELVAGCVAGEQRVTIGFDAVLGETARCGAPAFAWDARGATHALALDAADRLCLVALADVPVACADITRVLRRVDLDAPAQVLSEPVEPAVLTGLHAFALAMLSADLVGVMQSAVDAAVEYVAARVQFGVAVGTFQAVQHLAADAKVLLEGARSSMWYAAWAADELDPADALLAARHAKAYCSRVGREVVELQTQLFGGIAITWEERAHVRVRRVLLDRVTLGDEFAHEDAIASTRLGVRA